MFKHITIKNQLLRQKIKNEFTMQNQESTNMVNAIVFVSLAENGTIDDVTAVEHKELFDTWRTNIAYEIGAIRIHDDNLYRCLQSHVSDNNTIPNENNLVWQKMDDEISEFSSWSNPIGCLDTYNIGDRVSYNGKIWESTVNNNSWQPDAQGWIEIE